MISRRDFINVSARASCSLVLAGSALAGDVDVLVISRQARLAEDGKMIAPLACGKRC